MERAKRDKGIAQLLFKETNRKCEIRGVRVTIKKKEIIIIIFKKMIKWALINFARSILKFVCV